MGDLPGNVAHREEGGGDQPVVVPRVVDIDLDHPLPPPRPKNHRSGAQWALRGRVQITQRHAGGDHRAPSGPHRGIGGGPVHDAGDYPAVDGTRRSAYLIDDLDFDQVRISLVVAAVGNLFEKGATHRHGRHARRTLRRLRLTFDPLQRRTETNRAGSVPEVMCPPMVLNRDSVLLTDRVAVVTGGGSGIGRGIAQGLSTFGASVVIWERDPESCQAAAAEVNGLGLTVDVRESAEVDAALARTRREVGEVSILVNNAGGVFAVPFVDSVEKGWDALHRANLRHVMLCTHRVAKSMVAADLGGSIMSVTSIEGVRAAPGYAAYAAAKAGVISFTKTVRARTGSPRNQGERPGS